MESICRRARFWLVRNKGPRRDEQSGTGANFLGQIPQLRVGPQSAVDFTDTPLPAPAQKVGCVGNIIMLTIPFYVVQRAMDAIFEIDCDGQGLAALLGHVSSIVVGNPQKASVTAKPVWLLRFAGCESSGCTGQVPAEDVFARLPAAILWRAGERQR